MHRFHFRDLLPSLGLAAGMIVASLVAVFADPRWAMLAVPALLGITVVLVDLWQARLQGLPPRLSYGALLLASSLVVATFIVGTDDPGRVKQMLPILVSMAAAATTLRRTPAHCRRIDSQA